MVTVKYESSSQRRHHRLTIPLLASIGDKKYPVTNWSLGGFAISEANTNLKLDDELSTDIKINFQGFTIEFSQQIRVVRISDEKKIISFEYIELGNRETEILKYFSMASMAGEIVAFEDILKKIDVPVTPASLKPDTKPNETIPLLKRPIMSIVRSAIYLILGIIVFLAILKISYAYLFKLKVTTAVIESPIETIVAPASGLLANIYVSKDQLVKKNKGNLYLLSSTDDLNSNQLCADYSMAIIPDKINNKGDYTITFCKINKSAKTIIYDNKQQNYLKFMRKMREVNANLQQGEMKKYTGIEADSIENMLIPWIISNEGHIQKRQPLFHIEDIDLQHSYQLAKISVAEANDQIAYIEKKLHSAEEKLALYHIVATKRKDQAQSQLKRSQKQLQLEKNNLKRYQMLAEKGYLSKSDLDKSKQVFAGKLHNLHADQLEVKTQQQLLTAIEKGYFFGSDRVESNVTELKIELVKSKNILDNEKKKVKALVEKMSKLTVYTPFEAKIVAILPTKGSMISSGKPVMLLERNEQRVVYVYLTQNELSELILGSKAEISVPMTNKAYTGTVIKIDRTAGSLDEINKRSHHLTTKDRSGLAIVAIDNMSAAQIRQKFPMGLPVVVSFEKRW